MSLQETTPINCLLYQNTRLFSICLTQRIILTTLILYLLNQYLYTGRTDCQLLKELKRLSFPYFNAF